MPNNFKDAQRRLPQRPNLRHLKSQAKDLFRSGNAKSLADAQFKTARLYGFFNWAKLKSHLQSLEEIGQLKRAIDNNDTDLVKSLMTRNPALHEAPLGYSQNGPLTWVAECRIPSGPPTPVRLAMASWMIKNGSNVHQGGDGPLMRAALRGERIPMMELLVGYGANVNAEWNGDFPILFAPCESVDQFAMRWLLDHGANPNCPKPARRITAIDYLIESYVRSPKLTTASIFFLISAVSHVYDLPGVLDILRGRADRLSQQLDGSPELVNRRFPELECGSTGAQAVASRRHAATRGRRVRRY